MRRPFIAASAWMLVAFLYLPVVTLVVFAFQSSSRLGLPWDGPSLRWFQLIFADPQFQSALGSSIRVGLASSALAIVVATLAALAFTRYTLRYQTPLRLAAVLPITLPGLLVGLALLTFFSAVGLRPSLATVFLAHLVFVLPYVLFVMASALERLDPAIEEAARDLGASPLQAFWRTTFPLIWPAVLGAGILAFAMSFDEFLITLFVIGGDSTLPVFIWSRMRRTIDPSINAVATALLTIVFAGALTALALAAVTRRRVAAAGEAAELSPEAPDRTVDASRDPERPSSRSTTGKVAS
jgi:spermidine/putrescine transport system permease protein